MNDQQRELYVIDLPWFNTCILQRISKNYKEGVSVLSLTDVISNLRNQPTGGMMEENYVVSLIKSFNIGFFVSDTDIQFAHLLKHAGDERMSKQFETLQCREKLCRLHVFRPKKLPFGLWTEVLSKLFLHLDKIVSCGASAAYDGYADALTKPVKKTAEILKGEHRYWRSGFVYEDIENQLFFSVVKYEGKRRVRWLHDIEKCQESAVIKTEVVTADYKRCAKIMVILVNHINTILKEFGLSGAYPLFYEYSPCPTCRIRRKTPTLFLMDDCFSLYQQRGFDSGTVVECTKHPEPPGSSFIKVGKLFPELLYADSPTLLLSPCHQVEFDQSSRNIGAGGTGNVTSGSLSCHKYDPEMREPKTLSVAVKFQNDPYVDCKNFLAFKKESMMLLDASDHPYIVTVYGVRLSLPCPEIQPTVCTTLSMTTSKKKPAPGKNQAIDKPKEGLALVMEHALEGSLSKKLKSTHLNRILLYRIAFQVIDAIAYMHYLLIYHRDIKPGNILLLTSDIFVDTNVKVADFDTACFANFQGLKTNVGTVEYKAPEYYQGGCYGSSVDIWAYGVVLYELLTLCPPFRGINSHAIKDHVKNGNTPLSMASNVTFRRDGLCLKKLMEQCWKEPGKRPTGKDLMFLLLDDCLQSLLYSFSCGPSVSSIRYFSKFGERSNKLGYLVKQQMEGQDDGEHFVLHKLAFGKPRSEWKEEIDLMDPAFVEEFQNVEDIVYVDIITPNSLLMVAKEKGINKIYKLLHVKTGVNFVNTVSNPHGSEMAMIRRGAYMLDSFHAERIFKVERNNDIVVVLLQDNDGKMKLRKYSQVSGQHTYKLNKNAEQWEMEGIDDSNDFILITVNSQLETTNTPEQPSFLVMACNLSVRFFALTIACTTISNSPCTIDLDRQEFEEDSRFCLRKGSIKALFTVQFNEKYLYSTRDYMIAIFTEEPCFVVIPFSVDKGNNILTSKGMFVQELLITKVEVTAFCSIFDTLWFGYSNGAMLVFNIAETVGEAGIKRSINLLRRMNPYGIGVPVEMLVAVDCKREDYETAVVLSYGKQLNEDAFYGNKRCYGDLPICYPGKVGDERLLFNRTFLEQQPAGDCGTDQKDAKDLILFWHAEEAKLLERFSMKRSADSLRNENLRILNDHGKFNLDTWTFFRMKHFFYSSSFNLDFLTLEK